MDLHCGQIKAVPSPHVQLLPPSRRPHSGCVDYLSSWFVFLVTFPLIALAPDGLHAKGKQRDLHVLWVWGL